MADKTPKADALAAKIKRARQRADRLPRRRHEAEGALLDLSDREERLGRLHTTDRGDRLRNVAADGGGPQ